MALSLNHKESTEKADESLHINPAFSPVNKRPKDDKSPVPRRHHTPSKTDSALLPLPPTGTHSASASSHSSATHSATASTSSISGISSEVLPPFWATGMDGDVLKLHERVASIPITEMGLQFQMALEQEMSTYSMEQVVAAAPFEIAGRGIAGIEEMAQCVSSDKVYFGVLQIEIGHGTFARHKNVFIHFQGEDLKAIQKASSNRRLAAAKELIGHCHAAIAVTSAATLTVDWLFTELKRVFEGDRIAYKGSGKRYE